MRRLRSAAVVLTLAVSVSCGESPLAPPPGAELSFLDGPTDLVEGTTFAAPVRAVVLRRGGGVLPTATGEVELRLTGAPPGAELVGTPRRSLENGIARFTGLGVTGAVGPMRLEAAWRGLSSRSVEFLSVDAPDAVRIQGAAGGPLAVTVDGLGDGTFVNDRLAVGSDPVPEVGILRSSRQSNEVVLYGRATAPSAGEGGWTEGVDTAVVASRAPVAVPVVVWVVSGPWEEKAPLVKKDVRWRRSCSSGRGRASDSRRGS